VQKCPRCGYNEGNDWPGALLIVAFLLVNLVAGASRGPTKVVLASAVGWFLFVTAMIWKLAREDKNRMEHLRLHSPDAQRKNK
jgi:hypothetical protein